jgi:hypothetical protein
MTDRTVELDEHRGLAAQKATEIRRDLQVVRVDQAAVKAHQDEIERFLLSPPAASWSDLAERLRCLLKLFAADTQDARLQTLIARALDDIARLSG